MVDKGVDGRQDDYCTKIAATRFRAIGANPIQLIFKSKCLALSEIEIENESEQMRIPLLFLGFFISLI